MAKCGISIRGLSRRGGRGRRRGVSRHRAIIDSRRYSQAFDEVRQTTGSMKIAKQRATRACSADRSWRVLSDHLRCAILAVNGMDEPDRQMILMNQPRDSQKRIFVPTRSLEDWRLLLGDPEKHWVAGRSAMSMAQR